MIGALVGSSLVLLSLCQLGQAGLDPLPARDPITVGLGVGGGLRVGRPDADRLPGLGFNVQSALAVRFLRLGDRLSLAAGAHLAYERYDREVTVPDPDRPGRLVAGPHVLTYADFLALQSTSLELGRWRPFLSLAAGLALGHASASEGARLTSRRQAAPVARTGLGLEVDLGRPGVALGLELAHAWWLRGQSAERPFGDRLSLALWLRLSPTLAGRP